MRPMQMGPFLRPNFKRTPGIYLYGAVSLLFFSAVASTWPPKLRRNLKGIRRDQSSRCLFIQMKSLGWVFLFFARLKSA